MRQVSSFSIRIIPQKGRNFKSGAVLRAVLYCISVSIHTLTKERGFNPLFTKRPVNSSAYHHTKRGGMSVEKNWMAVLQQSNQVSEVMKTNQVTERYGVSLSPRDAELIAAERLQTLKEQKRVEFGGGIMPKIIYEFCDSSFIDQNNYVETLLKLQEIFYLYKNEMHDEISDDELLHFMKEQFETVCFGDLDYLESTCLRIFAEAVRAGYRGYRASDGYGEYAEFDEVERWDYELYLETLKELCWR